MREKTTAEDKRKVLLMFYGTILVITICIIVDSNFDINLIIKLN